jgi:hypothetical protein
MEYLVILLAIALVVVLYLKQPKQMYKIVANAIIASLRNKEVEIVQGMYNKLPQDVKKKVDSKVVAEIVSFTLGVIIDVLEESVKEDE